MSEFKVGQELVRVGYGNGIVLEVKPCKVVNVTRLSVYTDDGVIWEAGDGPDLARVGGITKDGIFYRLFPSQEAYERYEARRDVMHDWMELASELECTTPHDGMTRETIREAAALLGIELD